MQTKRLLPADLVFGLASALVLLSIALVNIGKHRQAARATSCENNLKNLALAIHNYHSAYKQMPMGAGGSSIMGDAEPWQSNDDRLSAFVGLSPFMEHQRLWEQIANPMQAGDKLFPPMGPVPTYDANVYTPWKQRPEVLVCPSEKDGKRFPLASSYTLNYGDGIDQVGTSLPDRAALTIIGRASKRGMFERKRALKFRDVLDGLSNTLMFSEAKMGGDRVAKNIQGLVLKPSLSITARDEANTEYWPEGRNAVWADGTLLSSGFQTILPPNSPSCTSDNGALEGVLAPSSHHSDGVHVAFADGRVQFISSAIDSGDSNAPSVAFAREGTRGAAPPGSQSPYGLWGALGTRASREVVDGDDPAIMPPQKELSPMRKTELMAKPAQVWTASNGKSEISARQIDLKSQSRVVLLTDDGDQKYVPLSMLQSEDAYRAVEQHLAEKLVARDALKSQLQSGLKLLDDRQFETFAAEFIVGGKLDPRSMAEFVKINRGLLIQAFESSLTALEQPDRPSNVLIEETTDGAMGVLINLRGISQMISRLQLKYIDGKWQLSP